MKSLPWILVVLLAIVCVSAWFRPREPLPAEIRTETKIKTIVRVDTLLIYAPMAPLLIVWLTDTIHVGDTVVQREQAYYGYPVIGRDWIVCRYSRGQCTKRLQMIFIIPLPRRKSVGDLVYRLDMVIRVVGMWVLG